MNLLDMRTVVLSYLISGFICMLVMAALWAKYRRNFSGFGFWLAGYIVEFFALALFGLRGVLPDVVFIMGGNAMIVAGTILLYEGGERFVGPSRRRYPNYILLAAYLLLQACFTFLAPDLFARRILFSAVMALLSFRCAWLMIRRPGRLVRPIIRGAGGIFAVFALGYLARLAHDVLVRLGVSVLDPGFVESLLILMSEFAFIGLTFALILTVNHRLFAILENDMAGQRHTEKILRLRLKLWEYAASHTMAELMQQALDEIEALTGSLIGFYHFVEEEQGTLTLQAWSTRTKETFCKAEGEGMHYAVAEAGVWVECLRARRPVIHNDYASLRDKKGLPPGHAPVVRELVVPTLREGRVVSVLGVGNKPSEYEESDIVLVAYIADLVWTIVTQRRSDEEILRLNDRLERLAMTDELTGIANRRAFFRRGAEEMKRSRRHGHPLALIMIDLDHFKNVNDSYGHDVGDRVLFCVAKTILANVRDIDRAARLGGEEFGLLLPHTGAADALILAERLRQAVEVTDCRTKFSGANVTISAGVAVLSAAVPDIDTLLKNADIALYQAKREGRNRVCFKE